MAAKGIQPQAIRQSFAGMAPSLENAPNSKSFRSGSSESQGFIGQNRL
jgi:hypothetical protein